MNVEQLIQVLQGKDPKAIVIVHSSNFELGQEYVDIKSVEQCGAVRKDKQCKDSFDGTRYTTTVWSGISVGSEEKTETVVRIS